MARQHLLPDMALISDALRAQETWDLVRLRLPGAVTSRLVPELYEATPERMFAVLQKTDVEADTVLMVGHNPGMQELVLMLVGEGNLQARTAVSEKYPTGALAIIDFPSFDWAHIAPSSGVLAGFVTPRSLK